MSYIPGPLDAKTDIMRSLMATFGTNGFSEENFSHFFKNAIAIIEELKIESSKRERIMNYYKKVMNENNSIVKRREDLLMISSQL